MVALLAPTLASSCATTPKTAPTGKTLSPAAGVTRIPDSAPERAADLRAAAPTQLRLEEEEHRWGVEAAKEIQRAEEQRETTPVKPPPAPASSIGVTPPPAAPKAPKPPAK
jgi:hypothetical protein